MKSQKKNWGVGVGLGGVRVDVNEEFEVFGKIKKRIWGGGGGWGGGRVGGGVGLGGGSGWM